MVKRSELYKRSWLLHDTIQAYNSTKVFKIINSCTTLEQINHTIQWMENLQHNSVMDTHKFIAIGMVALNHRVQLMNQFQAKAKKKGGVK